MYRYRHWWDGLEWALGAAAVFFVVGLVMLFIVLGSASAVQWTGIKVHGTTRAGVVTYTYHGSENTITDNAHRTYSLPHPATVWLSRSNPDDSSRAFLDSPLARWLDFSIVVVWFLIAGAFVAGGIIHHRRFI